MIDFATARQDRTNTEAERLAGELADFVAGMAHPQRALARVFGAAHRRLTEMHRDADETCHVLHRWESNRPAMNALSAG